MRQSKVIGVTGGIGAGKSTFLTYIHLNYSLSVISADEIGRLLMRPGHCIYNELVKRFGNAILQEDAKISTAKLSEMAFSDPAVLAELNRIEHPRIKKEIRRRITLDSSPIVFLEAALLKEGGLNILCDEIWYVRADREKRIERLMASRGYSREKCEAILRSQRSDEAFLGEADRVIDNSADFNEMRGAADAEIRRLAEKYGISQSFFRE